MLGISTGISVIYFWSHGNSYVREMTFCRSYLSFLFYVHSFAHKFRCSETLASQSRHGAIITDEQSEKEDWSVRGHELCLLQTESPPEMLKPQ